jgi:hypothetical protein
MIAPASPGTEGRRALEQIDAVLARKPEKDDYALADATQMLCTFRDALIEQAHRGGEVERTRLRRANAVLSIVVATHFPSGGIPWEPLVGARRALADLLSEVEETAPGR